jgi:hypothetical protein
MPKSRVLPEGAALSRTGPFFDQDDPKRA